MNAEDTSPANDRIQGYRNIAKFYGLTPRQAQTRIERGEIPYAMEGRRIVASRRALTEHWRRITSGTAA